MASESIWFGGADWELKLWWNGDEESNNKQWEWKRKLKKKKKTQKAYHFCILWFGAKIEVFSYRNSIVHCACYFTWKNKKRKRKESRRSSKNIFRHSSFKWIFQHSSNRYFFVYCLGKCWIWYLYTRYIVLKLQKLRYRGRSILPGINVEHFHANPFHSMKE